MILKYFNKNPELLEFYKIDIFVADSLCKYAEKILLKKISTFRKISTDTFGYIIPYVRVSNSKNLKDNTVKIYINGNEISEFKMNPDEAGANIFIKKLTFISVRYADEILRNDDATNYIKLLKKNYKNEYDYLIQHTGYVRRVLTNLLVEGISIKNIVKISELMCYYGFEKYNPDEISELIRTDRIIKHYIKEHFSENNEITAHELSKKMTEAVINAKSYIQELEVINAIKQINNQKEIKRIVCEKQIRLKLFRITRDIFDRLSIIAYEELFKTINIKNEGIINLNNTVTPN